MAKVIKYTLRTLSSIGTSEHEALKDILSEVTIGWNETNEEIAKREAHNGQYVIVDNDTVAPLPPTIAERIKTIEHFIEKLRTVFPALNI